MKQLVYLVLNSVTFVFTLLMNYLSGTGALNNTTVGEISARYENLFTPAGYAFAIWGLIYLILFAFIGFQWYQWFNKRDDQYLLRTGIWFMVGNLANGLWVAAWTNNMIGLSFVLILILLFSLLMLMFRLRLEVWDAPVRIIAFVWWPISIYIGWIVVATMANLAAYSVMLQAQNAFSLKTGWVLMLIVISGLVYMLLMYFRNMRESAFVGIWALVAIAVKQWQHESIAYASIAVAVLLFAFAMWQAIRNIETLPHNKIRRGEI